MSNNKIVKIVANALNHVSNNKIEDSYTATPNPNYFGRTPGGYLGEKFTNPYYTEDYRRGHCGGGPQNDARRGGGASSTTRSRCRSRSRTSTR